MREAKGEKSKEKGIGETTRKKSVIIVSTSYGEGKVEDLLVSTK